MKFRPTHPIFTLLCTSGYNSNHSLKMSYYDPGVCFNQSEDLRKEHIPSY